MIKRFYSVHPRALKNCCSKQFVENMPIHKQFFYFKQDVENQLFRLRTIAFLQCGVIGTGVYFHLKK